jgi:hypothetical protein
MVVAREDLKFVRQRRYLAKDFNSLRSVLLEYARQYYPDKIRDFSESSVGGLLLDLAAAVGDNLSFYLDHQFGELDPDTAVETSNIERSLIAEGVNISGAAPAVVAETFYIEVPAETVNGKISPSPSALPIIQYGTIVTSDNGVQFTLVEDVDFNKKNASGEYVAETRIATKASNVPTTFTMAASGLCISGKEITETFVIGSTFVPFRQLTLSNPNVSEIISVTDSYGNTYYNVSALTEDVVYRNVLNTNKDSDLVRDAIKVVPAPYRYTAKTNLSDRKTVLTFGGGSANSLQDDIIPDPSDFAVSFPYSRTFSRSALNPNQLLQTNTLGIASVDTTITITYRYGGGLDHNVPADTIKSITTLKMFFPNSPSQAVAATVKNKLEANNTLKSYGGDDALDVDGLKALIPAAKNAQSRIVSKPDVLARIYTMPSNFGRVFRASIRSNPNNPLATQLYVLSRDEDSRLITSPDTLKKNLKTYLNPYRMISDAIDILDGKIINLQLNFEINVDPTITKSTVLQTCLVRLKDYFDIKKFNIDQPIVIDEVQNLLYTTPGVLGVTNIKFVNLMNSYNGRSYSDISYDVTSNTYKRMLLPPPGAIFEIKYPEYDIIGRSTM